MKHRLIFGAAVLVALMACGSDDVPTSAETVPLSAPATAAPTTTIAPTTTSRPTTTAAPTTTVAPSTTIEAIGGSESVDEAAAAFERWVGFLGEGNHQAAWEAMAPTSQAAIGEELFFDSTVYEMSEGWGAWSASESIEFRLEEDSAGRTLLWVSGTVSQEGTTSEREMVIPVVATDGGFAMSPFEEFGNVAEGVREEVEGNEAPPVPADSGTGRRVVYSNSDQRVWLVEDDGSVVDSYLVSGKAGVPEPGSYEVYSRSETAFAGHDDITMRFMVRFAHGENLPIGFHAIPNDASGAPLQSEEDLGEYHSAGCVRQSLRHASFLYEWATDGTPVIALA